MSKQITVSDEAAEMISKIQKAKGFQTTPETVDYIGGVFVSRYKALQRYAEKKQGGAPKAKKAPAKKAAKAKGPIARKAVKGQATTA